MSRVPRNSDGHVRKLGWTVSIGGQEVVSRLTDLGLVPRKSLVAEMPDIPHSAAFIRGYFDGNGHVGLHRNPNCRPDALPRLKASFVGAHGVLEGIQEAVEVVAIRPKKISHKASVWQLNYNHADALRLADFMYKDGGPHLTRKRQIFTEGANQPPLRGSKRAYQ